MPSFKCKCGNILRYGIIPNKDEWLLISDEKFDEYAGEINSEELYSEMKSMLVCQNCKRIWLFWEGFGQKPVPYLPDL